MTQTTDPKFYLDAVFSEIPRILSLQDRNPFSKTYGCFHRNYWLHRTSDFPSAINQMGANILALLWANPLEDNPYYQNEKILEWCLASIKFWMGCQHKDGSFDEWYPNERGWAGPTGYLVHAMADSYFILKERFPAELKEDFIKAIEKAGEYLIHYNEEFILANHHAIALLPIYEAYVITKNKKLLEGFNRKFTEFEKYCYSEGWSLEYDGVDIGYLSGTVSFLSRLYKYWPDQRIEKIVKKAVEFTSYHLYPNGSFGGTMGSRQTGHFYHFGYEFWSEQIPLAASMAEKGLAYLSEGKLISPGVQEDHYVLYRAAEYIEAYLAHQQRPKDLPLLPWEGNDFQQHFPEAGIYVEKRNAKYFVINLKRGGVIKVFDTENKRLIINDSGWIAQLDNEKAVTSQWNDPEYQVQVNGRTLKVKGQGNFIVMKSFTPWKMILFRLFMLCCGWHSTSAYYIKAGIRKLLMVGARRAPIRFKRTISMDDDAVTIQDEFQLDQGVNVEKIYIGDEMPIRYVPQSRYFQSFELETKGRYLSMEEIKELNKQRTLISNNKIDY